MATPKRSVAYEFEITLVDSVTKDFRVDPTIVAGDFKISKDNGAFASLDTVPVVSPTGTIQVKVSLSAAEMTADKIAIYAQDPDTEWDEVFVFMDVPTANEEDYLILRKIQQNKMIVDDTTGVLTIYDDDDVTPFLTGNIYEDVLAAQLYQGRGIARRERLT